MKHTASGQISVDDLDTLLAPGPVVDEHHARDAELTARQNAAIIRLTQTVNEIEGMGLTEDHTVVIGKAMR